MADAEKLEMWGAHCCLCGEPCPPAVPPLTSPICWRCRRDDDQLGESKDE